MNTTRHGKKPKLATAMWGVALVLSAALMAGGCSKADRLEKHLSRADNYFASEKYEEAAIEYENARRLDPNNRRVIRQLGMICQEQGQPRRAYVLLNRALEMNQEDPEARVQLGYATYTIGGFGDARKEALKVLEEQPANTEAILLLSDSSMTATNIADTLRRLEGMRAQMEGKADFHVARATMQIRQKQQEAAKASYQRALELDAKNASAHLGLAQLAWSQGDLAEAGRQFQAAVDLSDYRSPIRLGYADFKIRTGRVEEGKALLTEMTEEAPGYLPAWNRLADLAYVQKDYARGLELTGKILSKDATSFEGNLIKGRIHLVQGEVDKALAQFERLNQVYSRIPLVSYQLAVAQLATNDVNQAIANLNKAVSLDPNYTDAVLLLSDLSIRQGDHTTAIVALNRLLQARPGEERAYNLLATAYLGRDSAEDALTVYEKMAEVFPENPQPHLSAGLLHRRAGRNEEARKSFEAALALNPEYMAAVEQLINLDVAKGDFASALARAEEKVEAAPQEALPLLFLASVHVSMEKARVEALEKQGQKGAKDYSRPIELLTRALELNPDSLTPYRMLAAIYVDSGKQEEALKELNAVLEGNPRDLPTLVQMGMIHDQMKNHEQAVEAYLKVLEIRPDDRRALNNLAYNYSVHLRDMDKAYEMALRARERAPTDPAVVDTLGWILYQRKEYDRALGLLRQSAARLPDEPEVMYHLGMTYYMMGEVEEAARHLKMALQSETTFPGREEIPQRLANLELDVAALGSEAVAKMEEALVKNPEDPVILLKLAAAHVNAGEPRKAVPVYERILQFNPRNVQARLPLSEIYANELGDTAKALELAREARDIDPGNPQVLYQVGKLAFQAGDHAWAFSLLRESARDLPGRADVLYDLARAYFSLGRLKEARDAAAQVRDANPPLPMLGAVDDFLAMADLALVAGKALEEEARIKESLARDPEFLPARFALALALQQRGQVSEARDLYEGILQDYDRFIPAHKNLALLLVEGLQEYDQALVHANAAREALPSDAVVARVLGRIMYERGNFPRAEQLLQESAAQEAGNGPVHFYLGMAQYEQDKKEPARAALTKALELDGSASYAVEARRVMEELR